MFHVRNIDPVHKSAHTITHPFPPAREEIRHVCECLENFFEGRPPAFRARLDFVPPLDLELEWMPGPGWGGFAALYEGGDPVSILALVPEQADLLQQEILVRTAENLFRPLLGDSTEALMAGPGFPLALVVRLPGSKHLDSTLEVLHLALAAYCFALPRKEACQQNPLSLA